VDKFHKNAALEERMILVLLLLLLLPAPALAQLAPEQVLNIRQISELNMSSDGKRVAFTVTEPVKGIDRNRDIWMLDAATRKVRQLTFSPKSESQPRWNPRKNELAFLSNRDGAAQIYVLPMEGGEASALTQGKSGIQSFDWSPDGTQIAYLAPDPKVSEEDQKEKDRDDARVVDRDESFARLWVMDVESNKTHPLTAGNWRISEMKWFPSGDKLLIVATDHPESDKDTERIFSIPAAGGQMTQIAAPAGPFGQASISRDGKFLTFLAARVDGPSPHDLYLQTLDGGPARNITGNNLDRPIGAYAWLADGSILGLVQTGFKTGFYRIARDGSAREAPLPDQAGNPGSFVAADSGAIAFVAQSTTKIAELWFYDGKNPAERVSHFNESWDKIPLIEPEFLHYKSFDGTEIEGELLTPMGSQGKRLPLITLIHGGPTGRWGDSFESWGQLLVSRGYAVFYPNVRGSTGYGWKFVEANRADWGGADFKDVMAGVDFLIRRGTADPDHLGIGGWSYGGYMAMWAVTQTNRFKASVAGAGLSDLASEYGTEAGPSYDEWFYGVPYEKPEGFIKSSPITYIQNAHTPTLILQGEADTTDPIGQSQQFYRGLKRYGVKSDLALYPREGHGFREEKHVLDMYRRILAWYDQYVKP
jgi:dipeptidyl aminopeptidase/acylaminoacyl peptidase